MNGGVVVARGKLKESVFVAKGSLVEAGMCAAAGPAEGGAGRVSGEHRRTRWTKAFEACDEGNKGYLNREDYKVAVVMLFGYKPSKMEVDSVMASVQESQSGISLDKFLNLMSTKKTAQLYHSEARHLFTAFDMQLISKEPSELLHQSYQRGPSLKHSGKLIRIPMAILASKNLKQQ
ncbi:EF-hand calcium-binding domain-containing protein 11 isoform X3 [Paroedura picta]|uniref:EF-hand calcium-binding domain-containing protein 11 isoform X3 n=1 Tax=Paroedura picta TaxID=143630 RepID=UPI0040579173